MQRWNKFSLCAGNALRALNLNVAVSAAYNKITNYQLESPGFI